MSRSKKSVKISEDICQRWVANPLVNPITGRDITLNGPTYIDFQQKCMENYGISPMPSLTTNNIPHRIGEVVVPKSKAKWNSNKFTSVYFNNIVVMFEHPNLKFVRVADLDNCGNFASVCDICLENQFVPDDLVSRVEHMSQVFKTMMAMAQSDSMKTEWGSTGGIIIPESIYNRMLSNPARFLSVFNDKLIEISNSALTTGLAHDEENLLMLDVMARVLNYDEIIEWPRDNFDQKLKELFDKPYNMQLAKLHVDLQELNMLREKVKVKQHSSLRVSSKSHSRELPASVSRERKVRKVPVQKKPVLVTLPDGEQVYRIDRDAPNEEREISYISEPGTNRSTFRSHAVMSAMTPLSPGHLEPLPVKKRTVILKELKAACNYMKDSISGKRFDRMKKKNLQLIVKLGNREGNQRCFYVRNIYKLWEQRASENQDLLEPETRQRVTDREKADIMHKIKYINKNAVDPDRIDKTKIDPRLELVYELVDNKYYKIVMKRQFGGYVFTIESLGYVPADIESVNGDINISSATVMSRIRDLFDNGKLLVNNFAPYTCCKIHLRKSIDYWKQGSDADRIKRFEHMADEVFRAV